MEKHSTPLSEAQRSKYRERLARLGCPNHYEGDRHPRSKNGPLCLSSVPRDSSFLPHFIEVRDLDELKSLAGAPDSLFASDTAEAPWTPREEWPADREVTNFASITPAEARRISNAGRSYVLGPSRRVASYKKPFEKLHMPFVLTTFSIEKVTVTPEQPLIIQGDHPVIVNFGTVTIVEGGQILVRTETQVNMQVLKKVPD